MEITLEQAKKQRELNKLPLNMRITGWISPYLIYIFSKLSTPPNLITFSWILLSFIGFYLISLGDYKNSVIGILVYHLALLLDSTDGGVARILKKTNAAGEFLDRFFSTINRSVLLLAVGFGLYQSKGQTIFLYLGIWSAALTFLENNIKMKTYEALINSNRLDLIKAKHKQIKESRKYNLKFYLYEAFRPGNHFTLLFFAIIFNLISIYLYVFSALIFLQFIYVFLKNFSFLKHARQNN